MLQTKSWEPEAVLALLGGILVSFVCGSLAVGLLMRAGAGGFESDASLGSVLLATLSFHGAVIVLGAGFLIFYGHGWREVFGDTGWARCLALACLALLVTVPVVFGLKFVSEQALEKLHRPVADQMAVEMILNAKPWLRAYLGFFAVVLAPVAEEFFFRGLLFSLAKQRGWPKLGWLGVSFLFALFHVNAPTFLPLFVLALMLTWLYEKTQGLLAPILAHSLFNLANLGMLLLAEKYQLASS